MRKKINIHDIYRRVIWILVNLHITTRYFDKRIPRVILWSKYPVEMCQSTRIPRTLLKRSFIFRALKFRDLDWKKNYRASYSRPRGMRLLGILDTQLRPHYTLKPLEHDTAIWYRAVQGSPTNLFLGIIIEKELPNNRMFHPWYTLWYIYIYFFIYDIFLIWFRSNAKDYDRNDSFLIWLWTRRNFILVHSIDRRIWHVFGHTVLTIV